MHKSIIGGVVAISFIAITSFAAGEARLKITSSAFAPGGNIPSRFTCDGSDTSPPLQITGIPSNAKSLVLIVDDPDAPGGLFTHWLVWNITPQTSSIAEGSSPKGVQGVNDFGNQDIAVRVHRQVHIVIHSRFLLWIANSNCALAQSEAK